MPIPCQVHNRDLSHYTTWRQGKVGIGTYSHRCLALAFYEGFLLCCYNNLINTDFRRLVSKGLLVVEPTDGEGVGTSS